MLKKSVDSWQTVIWSDESECGLFSGKGRVMVWRTIKQTFDPQCIVLTVKHGEDPVAV